MCSNNVHVHIYKPVHRESAGGHISQYEQSHNPLGFILALMVSTVVQAVFSWQFTIKL